MDFLFDNPITRMPGVWFLVLYGALILLTVIIIKICKSSLDWTRKLPLPLVSQNPDPFEIAYLRGGENEFARAVVFTLVQKGFLQITNEGKNSFINLTQNQPNWTTLSAMERAVLPWFQTTHFTKEIFDSFDSVTEILKPYSAEYERKIAQSNFLTPNDVALKTKVLALLAGGAVILAGAYKVFTSILSGHFNVGFTIFMAIISFVIFLQMAKTPRLSNLGKRYVETIQQTFALLREKIQNSNFSKDTPSAAFGAIDPFLLTVGVFGVGALSGTMYYQYGEAFQRANAAGGSWGSSSSCGSSCGSSCSSGDSGGSSCSSGSSCGSGCGGCGGGGD